MNGQQQFSSLYACWTHSIEHLACKWRQLHNLVWQSSYYIVAPGTTCCFVDDFPRQPGYTQQFALYVQKYAVSASGAVVLQLHILTRIIFMPIEECLAYWAILSDWWVTSDDLSCCHHIIQQLSVGELCVCQAELVPSLQLFACFFLFVTPFDFRLHLSHYSTL